MTWYAWPGLVFIVVFVVILVPPRGRWSRYGAAAALAGLSATGVTVLVLIVWGITR